MKLRRASAAILFATVLLMMLALPLPSVKAQKGPRSDTLIIRYFSDVESAYAALQVGQIDLVGYEITADLVANAMANPNIVVGGVEDSGMYEFDLNNNHTIRAYPGVPSPTHYRDFRQAIAFLTDKDYIITEIIGGFATRIDQPIAAPYYGW
ncbi:MAG: ABC transporter substrate-binding protein, partial [Candidatus Bathyarchaeia archaeon]